MGDNSLILEEAIHKHGKVKKKDKSRLNPVIMTRFRVIGCNTDTHLHIPMHACIYTHVCVCVCVYKTLYM